MTSVDTTTSTIGASVIDYIQRNKGNSKVSNEVTEEQKMTATAVNQHGLQEHSSVQTPPSIIPCVDSCNILLRGPPKSGRNSLVMNMAHSIASRQQQQQQQCSHCIGASCICVAVAILKPLCQENNDNQSQEMFPLSCDLVESSPIDFYGQLRALQETTFHNNTPSWNKTALRRIQVHRMTSVRDIMEFLLSVQGNNNNIRGAIIIQDLHVFVRGSNCSFRTGDLTTEQLMTMTQIRKYMNLIIFECDNVIPYYLLYAHGWTVALLVDTAEFLRRSSHTGASSFSIMVTMTDKGVPWNVLSLWSTWFSTVLKIQTPTVLWKTPTLEQDESAESQFVLHQMRQGDDNKEHVENSVAQYVTVRQNTGSFRIVWKRGSEE